jgi:Ca2+-binding EF-hand superfamily protein
MSVGNIPLRKILEDEKKLDSIARFAFSQVDKDNSGSITKQELAEIMNSIADDFGIEEPTNKEIDEVFRKLDRDESGLISFDEFKTLILRILELCED